MYSNSKPKEHLFTDLMKVAQELRYLLEQTKSYSLKSKSNEVFYLYNRAMHDMTENNGNCLTMLFLNELI